MKVLWIRVKVTKRDNKQVKDKVTKDEVKLKVTK